MSNPIDSRTIRKTRVQVAPDWPVDEAGWETAESIIAGDLVRPKIANDGLMSNWGRATLELDYGPQSRNAGADPSRVAEAITQFLTGYRVRLSVEEADGTLRPFWWGTITGSRRLPDGATGDAAGGRIIWEAVHIREELNKIFVYKSWIADSNFATDIDSDLMAIAPLPFNIDEFGNQSGNMASNEAERAGNSLGFFPFGFGAEWTVWDIITMMLSASQEALLPGTDTRPLAFDVVTASQSSRPTFAPPPGYSIVGKSVAQVLDDLVGPAQGWYWYVEISDTNALQLRMLEIGGTGNGPVDDLSLNESRWYQRVHITPKPALYNGVLAFAPRPVVGCTLWVTKSGTGDPLDLPLSRATTPTPDNAADGQWQTFSLTPRESTTTGWQGLTYGSTDDGIRFVEAVPDNPWTQNRIWRELTRWSTAGMELFGELPRGTKAFAAVGHPSDPNSWRRLDHPVIVSGRSVSLGNTFEHRMELYQEVYLNDKTLIITLGISEPQPYQYGRMQNESEWESATPRIALVDLAQYQINRESADVIKSISSSGELTTGTDWEEAFNRSAFEDEVDRLYERFTKGYGEAQWHEIGLIRSGYNRSTGATAAQSIDDWSVYPGRLIDEIESQGPQTINAMVLDRIYHLDDNYGTEIIAGPPQQG